MKLLENVSRCGYNPVQVFDDWLSLMLYALMRNDEKYLEIVRKYDNERHEKGKRPIDYFAQAFGLLLKAMQESSREILGEIYMQWNLANKYSGQFFTPAPIAEFMAKIASPKAGFISDPCCGSGIMLISLCKEMSYSELFDATFVGQDVDLTCVKMCALNMLFFNLNSFVIWGNTLKVEYLRVFQTKRSVYGGTVRELSPAEVDILKPKIQQKVKSKQPEQLTMF